MHPPNNLLYLLLVKYAQPRPQEHGADEAADAADQVDVTGSGLVVKAQLIEPALSVDPRMRHWVYYCGHEHCVNYVGVDECALS